MCVPGPCVCPWSPCVSLAPVAPRGAWGPPSPGWGSAGPLGGDRGSWALCWAQGLFLPCLERGRWRGRDCVRQRGLPWWAASSAQSFPPSAGIGGQLRGTAGTFSATVCQWHSPRYEATWKTGAQSRFNQLMVSGCAHTSACVSRLVLPLSYHDLSAIGPRGVDVQPHPGQRVAWQGVSLLQKCLCQTFP